MSVHSGSTHSNPQYSSTEEMMTSSSDAIMDTSRRERKLKQRIQELVETLEKLSSNSEIRHKQTNEYIADLKRANGALVTAYEKAKKRHARRLKKFEQQVVQIVEKYQYQVNIPRVAPFISICIDRIEKPLIGKTFDNSSLGY